MSSMRKAIRNFLNRRGYEIIKKPFLGDPYPMEHREGANVFKTPLGSYFLPANAPKEAMTYFMSRGKVQDQEVVDVARQYISPGTAVLDLGANFGQMSLLFAQMVGKEGKVYSFEAQKSVYNLLTQTIAINEAHNVDVIYGAVFNEVGKELFFPEADMKTQNPYSANGINPEASAGSKVVTLTVDSLNIQEPVSFMKVDVQGSDLAAMQGARETIMRNRMPIIFEFEAEFQNQFGTSFQDYVAFTQSIDYEFKDIILNRNYLIVPKT